MPTDNMSPLLKDLCRNLTIVCIHSISTGCEVKSGGSQPSLWKSDAQFPDSDPFLPCLLVQAVVDLSEVPFKDLSACNQMGRSDYSS